LATAAPSAPCAAARLPCGDRNVALFARPWTAAFLPETCQRSGDPL